MINEEILTEFKDLAEKAYEYLNNSKTGIVDKVKSIGMIVETDLIGVPYGYYGEAILELSYIRIFMDNILRELNDDLSHINQKISWKRYKSDRQYLNDIELSNNINTLSYMITHIDELKRDLNVS